MICRLSGGRGGGREGGREARQARLTMCVHVAREKDVRDIGINGLHGF